MKFRKKPESKFCNGCRTPKDSSLWSNNRSTKDGLSTQCKECMRSAAQRHYALNKTKVLARSKAYNATVGKYRSLEKKYGVPKDAYLEMVRRSEGKCELCGSMFKNKEPYLDHCHATQKIRGLLCNDCNVGLARFRDDATLLDRAKTYLRR